MPTTVTHTIGDVTRDYTTLKSWEAAQQRDLVSDDEVEVAECYDDGIIQNPPYAISGWTTDTTRYIKVAAETNSRHDGTESNGVVLQGSGSDAAFYILVPNVEVEGLICRQATNPKRDWFVISISSGSGFVRIHHCIICWNDSSTRQDKAIEVTSLPSGVTAYIWNCAIYGWTTGIDVTPDDRDVFVYNVSIFNCNVGFQVPSSSQVVAKNVSVLGSSVGDFDQQTYFDANSEYNASSNASGTTGAPGSNSIYSLTASDNYLSTTSDSEDLHMKDVDADLYNVGVDLTGDSDIAVTDDYEWESKSTSFSIGADEEEFITPTTKTFDIDAAIQEEFDSVLDLDILLSDENELEFSIDTVIFATETETFLMDASIADLETFQMDAAIFIGGIEASFLMDAIISGTVVENSVGINGTLREYTTVLAWEAAKQRDLVALDELSRAVCYDDGEMIDSCEIGGWTTDELHSIKITTPDSEKRYGNDLTKSDVQGFRYNTTAVARNITITSSNVWIDGIVTDNNNASASGTNIYVNVTSGNAGFIKISNCYSLRSDSSSAYAIEIANVVAGSQVFIWNNMGHNRDGDLLGNGIYVDAITNMELYIVHNTYSWKRRGIHVVGDKPGVFVVVNNVCLDCHVACFDLGTLTPTVALNNASSDTTAPIGDHLHNLVPSDNFKNLTANPTNRDLRIKDADADIYLAATKYKITGEYEDIFGALRDFVGMSESMGADDHLKAFFDMDTIIISQIDVDQQVNIFTNDDLIDIDHQVQIKRLVPSAFFKVRKPGVETLDYSDVLMRISRIVRRLEWDTGVSQAVKTSVEVNNINKKNNYLSSDGDFYPDHRFIWTYAGIKVGWGKNLDQDIRYVFVGRTEDLILIEQRKGNWVLIDGLRGVLDDETSAEITFNDAYVASQTNLDSLNPVHIVEHILKDLLDVKIWDFDTDTEVVAVDDQSFEDSFNVVAEILVNDTTWPEGTNYVEMIQGCLVLIGGWLYVGGDGKFKLKVFNPYDFSPTPAEFEGDEADTINSTIYKSKLNATRREIINRIKWTYGQADTEYGPFDHDSSIASYGIIKKDLKTGWEIGTDLLDCLNDRIFARFSDVPKYVDFSVDNLKNGDGFNAELADLIEVTDVAQGISAKVFQIIEKTENPLDRSSEIIAQDIEGLEGKFGMACSEDDEGDGLGITADDFDNWKKGFVFAGNADVGDPHYDSSNPGFDDDGDVDGVMDDDVAPFDIRGNSIELIFVAW